MPKNGSQKGAIGISTIVAIIIVAAVVAAVSVIATIKYYENLNISTPVAVVTLKSTPKEMSTPVLYETADWQTYKNDQLGFFIRHPYGWEFGKKNSELLGGETVYTRIPKCSEGGLECPDEDIVLDFRYGTYYGQVNGENIPISFEDEIFIARSNAKSDSLMKEENVNIAGVSAVKFQYDPSRAVITPESDLMKYEIYIAQNEGKIFTITATIKTSKLETYTPIFNQILSTFKFTK